MKMQWTDVGTLTATGAKVSAATDGAGPQIIVQGEGIHLLSSPLKNHEEAVAVATEIVEKQDTNVHPNWTNLKTAGLGGGLFAVFGHGLQRVEAEPPRYYGQREAGKLTNVCVLFNQPMPEGYEPITKEEYESVGS